MNTVVLSPLMLYENEEKGWKAYEENLYSVFCHDLRDGDLTYRGKTLKIRYQPMEYDKEEAFFHITCQDYKKDGDRVPDFRRCERIRWVKQFICADDENAKVEFEGTSYELKTWAEQVKNDLRHHILCEELKYMVVVAERDRYCLLITAYYFEHDHSLMKKLKKYNAYKAKNASHK